MAANNTHIPQYIRDMSDLGETRMLPPIKGYNERPLVSLEEAVKPLVSIVPDVTAMISTVKHNCDGPIDGLTQDEAAAIMLYSMEWMPHERSLYLILNSKLRNQNRQELIPWFLYLHLLIYALSRLPSCTSQIIYRAVKTDIVKEFTKGKTICWWGFSSCTTSLDVLERFISESGIRFIFNIESNSGKDISRYSFFRSENEILLYPARMFEVKSVLNSRNDICIVHLKEITPPHSLIDIPSTSSPIIQPSASISSSNKQLRDRIGSCRDRSVIDLANQKLTDNDMEIVVKHDIISKECKKLFLNGNLITSDGASILVDGLKNNIVIEELHLSYNRIGDLGVKLLSFSNAHLKHLILNSTGITDDGIGHLSEMLKTDERLTLLGLESNEIGDRGAQLLINVLINDNKTLKTLSLSDNKGMSDLSIDSFIQMFKINKSLTRLHVRYCNISKNGATRLRNMKPKSNFCLII